MDKFIIKGGKSLNGTVTISGSKNACLPLMVASLLCKGTCVIEDVPDLKDVKTLSTVLEYIGAKIRFQNRELIIDTSGELKAEAPYEYVKKMRASIYVLGPLLSRFQQAKVSLPGGCAWGPRPVDLHITAMQKLGAQIEIVDGYIIAHGKLRGAEIYFDKISVGATANALMASVLAEGKTILENCAIEPEVSNLAEMLLAMGAQIHGIGTRRLEIEGVKELKAVRFKVIPDRIEAGTYMAAAAMTQGNITLENVDCSHLTAIIRKMEDAGCQIFSESNRLRIIGPKRLKAVDCTTEEYPGFPTDMQAQWMAMMSIAEGTSIITDTIYHDRFSHAAELMRLSAEIKVNHNSAVVKGKETLSAAKVMSTDLRASASLVLAGCAANGYTEIARVYHIDRGYEAIEIKLSKLGADIQRVNEKMEYDI